MTAENHRCQGLVMGLNMLPATSSSPSPSSPWLSQLLKINCLHEYMNFIFHWALCKIIALLIFKLLKVYFVTMRNVLFDLSTPYNFHSIRFNSFNYKILLVVFEFMPIPSQPILFHFIYWCSWILVFWILFFLITSHIHLSILIFTVLVLTSK